MEHSFNKVIDLLFLAREEGVELVMNDERLQLKVGVNKAIDETLLKEIRNNKQLIIDYLKSDNWQATRVTKNNNHKITRFDRDSLPHIPLSFSQERLWFIDHLEGSVQYHSPAVMRLVGNLNKEALLYALRAIISRQDALRTVFHEIDGKVYQSLKTNEDWELQLVDGSAYKEDAGALKLYIEKLVKEPFDLANDYPIRGSLIRLDDQEHILVVTMHHIASDAWSISIIVKEVVELYSSFVQGRQANLETLPVQYADFAVWQRNYLQGAILEKKINYWKNKLEGQEPLQLPTDYTRPPVRSTRGASTGFKIEKELAGQLHELSRQQGVSLFMLLLAAFKVLLQRYSSQEDISVGTSIASRQQKELEGLVGFFVNTLALRTEFSSDISFAALLEKVKSTTLEAYEHQEIPFDKVVEIAVSERDPSRSPLFQVMLVLQNTPESSKLKLGELVLSAEPFVTNVAKFDITLFITETPNGFMGSVDYSTDLYQADTMKRMTDHFTTLLRSVVADPQQKIGLLTMLSNEEERQLVEQFNSAAVAYPKDKTFVELFEEQVVKTPGNIALVFEKDQLSYRELNERSNQLAHYLKSKGVKPNSLVPLYMERSASMIIGLLGIMKAGAAYVPVDTDFPADRISYMLQDAGASIIVSSKAARISLEAEADAEIIEIEDPLLERHPSGNLPVKPSTNHLAYVIYTSGSTGRPKGVMIEHCSLVDYYYGLNKYTHIDQCSSFALVSTIATDLGNTVIYASLLSGGALHVFTKESVSNIEYLHRYFREVQIECVKIVPSHWKALSTTEELLLPSKLLVFGGETLQAENVAAIRMSGSLCQVVNHYGPTETTVGKLLHLVQPEGNYEKRIPVGKPFSNTQVYVLSRNMQLCPIGVPGKLYIAGDGVARGYFNNRELTEEKFILNPFKLAEHRGAKMYATGDLVKWLPDGNIEFIGRVDNQVQIRGYRVEPGEVENVLEQCEQVKQGVVLAKLDRQGNNRLIAYVVANEVFDREEIVDYLKKKLPEYMIPAVLMEVERIPLTANGKINRKALPDPDVAEIAGDKYVAPRNETEEKLARIWAEVLEVDQVGVHDDFFELGGHSLLAVRLISAMRKAFNVEMPIGDIFDYPTVAMLSARVPGKKDTVVLPSIEPVHPRPEYIPLSFSQERLWFLDRLQGSQQYHVPAVLRLTGKLNKAALAAALQNVVNRHEVLRTVILQREGISYQQITGKDSWQLSVVDGSVYKDNQSALQRYIQELIFAPFDLPKDHMMRAHLIAFGDEEYVLVFNMHHIASDGWSRSILVQEVVEGYSAFENGRPINLPALPVQYADYAIWQRNHVQGEILEKKLGYWKDKLHDITPLQLPTDFSRPKVQSARGASAGFVVDERTLQQLHELSTQQGVTLFMTLLAAFNVLLHRYSGQQDICVGTPVAGRQQQELEGLIGFFVNTLALRSEVDGSLPFNTLLKRVKATTLEAYEHQEIPFEKVVDSVVKERDLSRNPLFQVMLVLRNTPDVPELNLGEVSLKREARTYSTSLFEISLFITENAHGLQCAMEYSTDLFTEATIGRMTVHFKELLHSIIESPEQQVALLPIVSAEEKQQLLVDFNDTLTPYPVDKSIVALFEEQVAKTPRAVAVIFEKKQLSFTELNRRANQLAHYLVSKGIGGEMRVPICIERSPEMIVAILGILKTGAAFLPVDPEYPVERINYLIANTGAEIVISNQESRTKLQKIQGPGIILIDTDWPLINKQPATNLQIPVSPQQLAYVIYTSGSTGMPKGVLIEHGGVVNLLKSIDHTVGFTSGSGLLSVTTFSFDIFYLECFMPLINGARLFIVSREIATNGFKLATSIHLHQPTHIQATPATWQLLLDAGWENKEGIKILVGGEAIREEIKDALTKIGDVYNLYGPTETTIWSVTKKLEKDEKVLIGKPIANTSIYIVGEAMQMTPIGVVGEICIGGVGLARGYLNQAILTAEKFIGNSFSTTTGARIYKTGDLGRWLPDGNIEYLGRIDDQVKIRGYRIELGEIENTLQQSGLVAQAAVVAKENKYGDKQLVAYIVPQGAFSKDEIVIFLKDKLPAYMVPPLLMEIESLPLTPNGKVDKKALPDPEVEKILIHEYVAPRTATEIALAEIWQDLLGIERVGIRDNFFDLGGHSLLAMRVVAAVRKRLNIELLIKDIFVFDTIGKLAIHLEAQSTGLLLPAIEAKPRPEFIPLSFSQERLWFIDLLEGSEQYHIPAVLQLQGKLSFAALQQALKTIISRHQVLRTVIHEKEGLGNQYVIDENNFSINRVDGTPYRHDRQGLLELVAGFVKAPFDLSADYMLRAVLIQLAAEEFVLVVTMHHIASDGWSMSVLVNEFAELYRSFIEERPALLADLPIQYADYAIWQRTNLTGALWDKKIGYWKEKLEGVLPLDLPTDYARPAVLSTRGAVSRFKIDQDLTNRLHNLSRQQEVTLFMTLLSVLKVLLYRYSGQQDICVGTPVVNRTQKEVEGLIGFFVNTLALRSEVDGKTTFTELLQQVKLTTFGAYEHQEVPFEKVVDAVVRERDMSRSPLFQVMLVLQNTPDLPDVALGGLRLSGIPSVHTTSKFDLTFSLIESADNLYLSVEYCTDLFYADTINRMAGHFVELLHSVVKAPLQTVDTLPMLSSAEENQLLVAFNDTTVTYPANKTIVDLFEEQAAKTPEHIAVVFEEEQLSYEQLNTKANQLAHYLRSKGVTEDTLVPVCIERSVEMIVAVMGILKAGAAYVPIDPEYPQERIAYMLADTAAALLISSKESSIRIAGTPALELIEIDRIEDILVQQPAHNPALAIASHQLSYVIYTSGSTGKPKGVMVQHSNLYAFICWCRQEFSASHFDMVYATTSICFDLSVFEIFYPLSIGKPVRIVADGLSIGKHLPQDVGVLINTVPVVIRSLLQEGTDLSHVTVINMAGEPIPVDVQQKLEVEKIEVRNLYGPTEDTTYSTVFRLRKGEAVRIGKPISNTTVHIVNKAGGLVPVGVAGEICLGGLGVTSGYLHQAALTKEKFVGNPFSTAKGARMYKTGDLGRWLADGNIEYLGRIDEQVKVRGYRIELGEIEAVLQQSGLVKQAVVAVKNDRQSDKLLVAYIVPQGAFNKNEIIAFLKDKLPAYMVPQLLMEMESLPLTPNGKVDKKALPDPDAEKILIHEYVAPRTATEIALAEIWQDLLGIEQVGIYEDFFSLGGHSLLAMRLVSAIRKKLQAEIAIRSLFQHSTIAALAEHLQTQQETLLLPAIEVQPRPAHIPLSFSQERLWFIDRLQGSVQYHIPAVLRLQGTLDVTALSNALQQIVNRHEVLRTVIREEEGTGYQQVKEAGGWQLEIIDGSIFKDDSPGLQQLIGNSIKAPFDLSTDYMLRATLISLDEENHVLLANVHHIASDGWSISIIVRELAEFYNSRLENRQIRLLLLPVQYADYALWQRRYLQGEAWEKKLGYWKDKLQGTAPLQLPTDYNRPPVQSNNGAITGLRIDKQISDALQTFSQQQGTTLFMTLLATFNVLLYRYSNQQDICVGTPIAGRQQQELEGLIGFFVNTLALRSEVDGSLPFTSLLQQVKATTLEAYEHQEIPFEKVVEAIVKDRDMSRSPLFQVMLVLQNTPEVEQLQLGQLQLSRGLPGMSSHTSSKFDLIFNVSETSRGLALTVEYCTDLYGELTVSRMMAHFLALLHSVVKAPLQTVDTLPMLSVAEEKQLLIAFNDTTADYPTNKTIVELFEEQAAKTPEHTAVVFGEEQLSYGELNTKANQLASYLRKKGVEQETLVPLCMERNIEMIIAVVAILKAGAAYVPIDPEYPQERIAYMLEDMGVALLISTEQSVSRLATAKSYAVVNPLEEALFIHKEPATNRPLAGGADKLLYVLYTSGSTGRPKGVRMANSALVNLLSWQQKQFINKGNRRVLQFASLNFDVSFQEIFSTLCFGGRLYLIAEERRKDITEMLSDIDKYAITHLFLPYIVLKTLAEYAISLSSSVSSLEEMMIAGEQLKLTDDIRKLLSNSSIKLINQYGPTEAHVVSSYTINTEKDVSALPPIGKPIDNTYLYILGAGHQLVPVGVAGELYIGGVQVARGYLNLPELTAERFMSDPFRKEVADSRMYKTGDLARWLPDGNIEYLGRIDGQVKVRGYRIELGEIEAVLQQSKLVEQAVVVAKEDSNGNKNLIAYVVTAGVFDQGSLISYLKAELPAYMVPQVWVQMEHFPLTNSGKIDRQALPDPGISQLSAKQYEAPRDELETRLVNIWQELLGISQVGIHDNFFDIGGHSLYAIRLVWLIRKKMNISVSVNDIFIYPTVAALAGNIVNKVRNPSLPDLNIKYLVPIKTTGSKPPLYVVAGGGGTALKIKKFAEQLDAGQPVYVFQPPIGDADLKGFPDTIEGIATVFIEELLIQNPDGPYALSGHCIGGIVAFEMAKQLQLRGKKVHSLAMFDTIIRRQIEPEPGTLKNLYHIPSVIQRSLSRFMLRVNFQTYMLRNHPRQSMLYKVNTFRSIRNRIKRKNFKNDYLKYAGEEIFEDSIEIYIAAYKNYKLHPYDGKIILFFATDRYFFLDRNNNIGYKKMLLDEKTKTAWNDYATNTTVYEIKGEHSDIFAPIHGEEFAKTLQKHLDRP